MEWIERIGGEFSLLLDGVAVQLTEAKTSPQIAEDILGEVSRGQAMMLVKKFVSVIGFLLWIASVAPVARPHVSVLW